MNDPKPNRPETEESGKLAVEKVSTASVYEKLIHADSFGSFARENDENLFTQDLSQYLRQLLRRKKLRRADVVRDSALDKGYVYQIFDGEKMPSRDKLIALAFGLHLDEEETQRMLRVAGYSELYVKIPRDALILYSLRRGRNVMETDDALYENGYDTMFPA